MRLSFIPPPSPLSFALYLFLSASEKCLESWKATILVKKFYCKFYFCKHTKGYGGKDQYKCNTSLGSAVFSSALRLH